MSHDSGWLRFRPALYLISRCGRGGTGRRAGLKNPFLYRSAGSTPAARTNDA